MPHFPALFSGKLSLLPRQSAICNCNTSLAQYFHANVIGICRSAQELVFPGAVKLGLPQVVQRLIKWRVKNGLSQRGAVETMKARGLDVSLYTLQTWEQGYRQPGRYAAQALNAFLKANPVIENPPQYRPGRKKPPEA